MKRILPFLLFASFLTTRAQQSVDVQPYSFVTDVGSNPIHHVVLDEPDMEVVKAEDDAEAEGKGRYRFAVHHQVDFSLTNSGTWLTLPNGDRVWRLKLTSTNAKATIMYFDQFFMPAGGRVHVYSEDKSEVIGAFTSYNNHESGFFATDHIYGQTCIVEYYEPVNVNGQGVIHINEVGHAYRSVEQKVQTEEQRSAQMPADICEVNVKCPEGNSWWQQTTGAVRIRIKIGAGTYWCSGSLVNNTSQDCAPYVLSAWHCGEGSSVSDRTQWVFYYNYQRPQCASGTATTGQNQTGCTVPAHSNDGGGATGSDFMLCQLTNPVTSTFVVYFNGWDASGTGSSSGVSIHHPSGDMKKISTYGTNLLSSTWGGTAGTHWRVIWMQTVTNWGVTEGGSSGSPIFNSTGRIIGTLTGGASYCDGGVNDPNGSVVNQDDPDYYGKMSYHWQSNANPSGGHLKQYLDPGNTGATTLDGKWACAALNQEEFELDVLVSVFPNPASDFIYIENSSINHNQLFITLYDNQGKLVYTSTVAANAKAQPIPVKNLESGMYVITVNDGERTFSKKVLVQH